MSQLVFPKLLEPYRSILEQSKTKFLKIKSQRNQETLLWQSKFGGMPFLPLGVAYPKDAQGMEMYLLAQINFEEIPAVIDYLPRKGILQIYIADDEMYGMNLDAQHEQEGFRVLYFADIDKENFQRDLPNLPQPQFSPLLHPLQAQQLTFEVAEEMVGLNDAHFDEFFGKQANTIINLCYEDEQLGEWIRANLRNAGHKIGGYANFIQEDPRRYNKKKLKRFNTLLLQIYSSDDICWGDCGIGNFFINQKKLQNLDFSDVLYNWDCG